MMELDKTASFIGELCVSCRKPILSAAFSKNIHTDDVKLNKLEKTIKINVAMEMIAGQKICNKTVIPQTICETCYKNLEMCLNFKAQLEDVIIEHNKSLYLETTIFADNDRNTAISIMDNSHLNNTEDQINVDKSSDSETSEDEGIMRSLRDDLENDNSNAASESQTTDATNSPRDNLTDRNVVDIESDIDVCSGEDDEILELDVHREKNETIQLDTSSESDIDVCDYEPTGKRMKNYTLFPIH